MNICFLSKFMLIIEKGYFDCVYISVYVIKLVTYNGAGMERIN